MCPSGIQLPEHGCQGDSRETLEDALSPLPEVLFAAVTGDMQGRTEQDGLSKQGLRLLIEGASTL